MAKTAYDTDTPSRSVASGNRSANRLSGEDRGDTMSAPKVRTWRDRMKDIEVVAGRSKGRKGRAAESKPRAYSYLRFSTPEQQKGDSFRRQTALATRYAAEHGLELDNELTFEDLGVSAYRGRNAAEGQLGAFLEAVKSGAVPRGSYLLIENLDRLSRQSPRKALRTLESIVDEGTTLVTLSDNREYTAENLDDDPTALMMSILIFMRANEESTMKARRLRASWDNKRSRMAEGRPMTAKCPGWLRLNENTGTFEVIAERAKIVREIYERAAEGEGQNSIAQSLNGRGVPVFGRGIQWHVSYIAKILESPAVVGTMIPHRIEWIDGHKRRVPLEPVEGYYPAVVGSDVFARVQALRSAPSPYRGKSSKALRNALGGLAGCPKCGAAMTRVTKGSGDKAGQPYLVCTRAKSGSGCDYKAVHYSRIEDALIHNAAEIVSRAPVGTKGGELDRELENVEAALDNTEDAITYLLDFIEGGGEPNQTTRDRLAELEAEVDELGARRSELRERAAETSSKVIKRRLSELKTALTAKPLDRNRVNVALRTLVDRVVIDHEAGTLVIHWRHGGETEVSYTWPAANAG